MSLTWRFVHILHANYSTANLFYQSLYDSWLDSETSFLYNYIFCVNLFSPDQGLYNFWCLWFHFHLHVLLLQLHCLVRCVQPCFVDGVSGKVQDFTKGPQNDISDTFSIQNKTKKKSFRERRKPGCSRAEHRVASTFFSFANLALTFFCLLEQLQTLKVIMKMSIISIIALLEQRLQTLKVIRLGGTWAE